MDLLHAIMNGFTLEDSETLVMVLKKGENLVHTNIQLLGSNDYMLSHSVVSNSLQPYGL